MATGDFRQQLKQAYTAAQAGQLDRAERLYRAVLSKHPGNTEALAGLADFLGDEDVLDIPDAWQHMIGNVLAVVLALLSFGLRLTQGAEAAVLPWGLTLSTAVVAILVFTGWKGGELVYRHGVGVQSGADYYGRRRPRPEDEERTLH